MAVNTYLFFDGQCAEAFMFYGTVFGGTPQIQTFADLPPGDQSHPTAQPHHVLHAALDVDGQDLFGSDGDGGPKGGFAVCYAAPDMAKARSVFDALGAGGSVSMPLEATFWSPGFGMLVDRFGVKWMIQVADGGTGAQQS
jgi:PhnB protein